MDEGFDCAFAERVLPEKLADDDIEFSARFYVIRISVNNFQFFRHAVFLRVPVNNRNQTFFDLDGDHAPCTELCRQNRPDASSRADVEKSRFARDMLFYP